jgi:hypothetical protein
MTAIQKQLRRDTTANLSAATPAIGEPAYNTTTKRLSIGDGSRAGGTEIPNFTDVQAQSFTYATAGGTADVLTLTLSPALLAYASGDSFEFKAASTNTTNVTINVSGLGAKAVQMIKAGVLSALVAGDIVAGGIYRITYDGTQFQMVSSGGGGSTQASTSEVANQTAVTKYISPDRLQYSPLVAKAYANVDWKTSGSVYTTSNQVQGCTASQSGGNLRITFSTAMSTINYIVVAVNISSTGASLLSAVTKTVGYCDIASTNGATNNSANIIVFGT